MGVKTAGVGHFTIPTAPAAGTSVTSGAANVFTTTYVQLIASTAAAIYITGIHANFQTTSKPTYVVLQIATGGAGSEVIVDQEFIPLGDTSGVTGVFINEYVPIFPYVPVATGTRIAVKTADSVGSIASLVSLSCINQSNVVDDGIAVGTVTTVTNQLTAAQIATGVWQDTTAGDFTVASSVGKSVMNGVALGTGLTINALTTNNDKTGYGISAAAVSSIWQDTTAGDFTTALSVGKSIMNGVTLGTGLTVNALTTNNDKTGYALSAAGISAIWQDTTAGDFTTASSIGKSIMNGVALGTGLTVNTVTNAVTLSAGDSPVMQSGTAGAGGASTITIQTALGADSLPVGCVIKITSGLGAKQARVITAYVDSTKVVTVDRAWTTQPDSTSVYSILYAEQPALSSGLKITGVVLTDTTTTVTNQLTAAAIATGIWQDAIAGDFTVASSIGKALYIANIAPGANGGHFIAGANVGTTTVGNLTITTALSINGVSNVAQTGDSYARLGAPAGASIAADLAEIEAETDGIAAIPTSNPSAASIATAVWTDTTAGDFTVSASIGKSVMNGIALGTGLTIVSVSGAVGSVTARVTANTDQWNGTGVAATNTAGVPVVDSRSSSLRINTATAGGATSITLDAGASATTDFYKGASVSIISGTGVGQSGRIITAYNGSTQVATVTPAWATNPANGSVFALHPAGSDIETILGTASKGAAGYVGIDWSQINAPTSTVGLSGTTVGTVTTVTNQLTAAAIATGVWQDAVAGDFTTTSSIGKALYINDVAPGGSGGHLISGSNAGTTTFGAVTVTGALTVSAGITITNSTTNGAGVSITGNGSGAGIISTAGATGVGVNFVGGGTSGDGFKITATSGHAINATAGGSARDGIHAAGAGSGHGGNLTGGINGHGLKALGGSSSGDGIRTQASSSTQGSGMTCLGDGIGLNLVGGTHGGGNYGLSVTASAGDAVIFAATGAGGRGLVLGGGNGGISLGGGQALYLLGGAASAGGAAGPGIYCSGGQASATNPAAEGMEIYAGTTGAGGGANGISITASGNGDGINSVGAGTGTGLRANIIGNLTGTLSDLSVTTFPQPGQGASPASATVLQMTQYLYKAWRNRSDQTNALYQLYNDDAVTVDQRATVSDDGTTFTRQEVASGP